MKLLRVLLIAGGLWGVAIADECYVSDYYCDNLIERSRTDNIPQTHVAWENDEFLTGYIQALIDTNYYEFQVRVVVREGMAYVFNLPCNDLLAESIICYIYDVPCIRGVQPVECSVEEFFCECDECLPASCQMPLPTCQIGGIWLPQSTVLFAPLVADPRQVTNSAALRFNDDVIGKRVGAVSFGDEFIIYRWLDVLWWHGDMEIGAEAGIFAVFDLKHPHASMVNTDFFVGPILSYAFDCWSFRLRVWHLSSHLGDEFLIAHPGYDRRNLSDEGIDFFASYQCGQAIRLYAGIGDIFDRDETFPEKPVYFEWGTEVRVFGCRSCYDRLYVQPFFAMNFCSWQEHDFSINQTYVLGVEWSKIQGVGRKLRIFLEYHDGYSKEGQFVKDRSNYAAIRMTYGF